MFRKKGQAALEFLTTYGWAFLVILVMIGALSYFGVFSPENYVPDQCNFGSVLSCSGGYGMSYSDSADADADISTIQIDVNNILPDNFLLTDVEVKEKTSNTWVNVTADATWTTLGAITNALPAHETDTLVLTIDTDAKEDVLEAFAGDKKTVLFRLTYRRGTSTIDSQVEGTVTTTVLAIAI